MENRKKTGTEASVEWGILYPTNNNELPKKHMEISRARSRAF